jgi:hypothetical protein
MSAEIEAIDKELDAVKAQLQPLLARRESLNRERRKLASLEFIRVNGIAEADVEMSSGNKPWFHEVDKFVKWMKSQPTLKRFAEWNETIYFTSDLLSGNMPDMPATIRELPKKGGA